MKQKKLRKRKSCATVHNQNSTTGTHLTFYSTFSFLISVSIVSWCITSLWWSPEEPQHCVYHLLLHGIYSQDHCFWPSGKTNKQHLHTCSLSRLARSICFSVSSYYSFMKRFILVDSSRACSSCPWKTQRVPFHTAVTLSASLLSASMVTAPLLARGVPLNTTWLRFRKAVWSPLTSLRHLIGHVLHFSFLCVFSNRITSETPGTFLILSPFLEASLTY